jgi:hypothetical protein
MLNPRRRLDVIEKIGSVAGVAFSLIIALFSDLPISVLMVVIFYALGFFIYLLLPWESWEWKAGDTKKEGFKKIFRWWHNGLLLAVILIPIICVLGGLSVKLFPKSADETLVDGIEDASKNAIAMGRMKVVQANLLQTNAPAVSGSVIGIVKGQSVQLLPTEAVIREVFKPVLGTVVNVAAGLAVLIVILVCAVLTGEKFVTKIHQTTP